jgi:hypothetical protein
MLGQSAKVIDVGVGDQDNGQPNRCTWAAADVEAEAILLELDARLHARHTDGIDLDSSEFEHGAILSVWVLV